MAGYSKIYLIGGTGGFEGVDGINPIYFEIFVGDADRQWLEVSYFDKNIKPIGNIHKIIPEGPNHPNSLIDACIAFYPEHFKNCPSMKLVEEKLSNYSSLDFDLEKDKIPEEWFNLREEAMPYLKKLNIFKADIRPYKQWNL